MITECPAIRPDKKHPLRCAVYDRFMRRSPLETKSASYIKIAAEFGISVPTVQRYIRKMQQGIFYDTGSRQGRTVYRWDAEALSFLESFYLAAIKEVGECSKRNAYRATVEEARKNGWSVGSESSAYVHLNQINPAMILLAKGGRRALDNMFYISRDLSTLRPFQLIVGDQHRFDFWCMDDDGTEIRAECYLWLDMATRMVYGVSFDKNYNSRTVVRALRTGIQRFGKFESTYNDNGSSEKSALADNIVSALQSYGVRFLDEADLYHADNGRYIVEDTEGMVVDIAQTKAEWESKHRRIFARVKNAKTKPIERFFSTLEQILRDLCLPGYVKEVGLSAPEEEQATKRLAWQRKSGFFLTYDEFIKQVLRAIDIYEGREHSTLGASPKKCLENHVRNGWQPTFIDKRDESYLFMESRFATVKGDRIQLGNKWYIGPDLTAEMVHENRNTLTAYNRKKIKIHFDPENLDIGVFAIEPNGNAIALRPVEKIDMMDENAVSEQLEWKNRNVKAVQDAFNETVKRRNVKVLSDPEKFRELRVSKDIAARAMLDEANAPAKTKGAKRLPPPEEKGEFIPTASVKMACEEMSDEEWREGLMARFAASSQIKGESSNVFLYERDYYQDILTRAIRGERISQKDMEFKFEFERKMTPEQKRYFKTFTERNLEGSWED